LQTNHASNRNITEPSRATQLRLKNLTQENQRFADENNNSRGTREAGHQSQTAEAKKVISLRGAEKPQKSHEKGLKTKASK